MVTNQPLVTVICLCYNQAPWVEEAIESVRHQTYPNIQLIVVDDASTDDSQQIIQNIQQRYPDIEVMLHRVNQGNCRAFNLAYQHAKGDYLVDLAADDVFMPHRIEKQVACFKKCAPQVGVVFTDATYIDDKGGFLRHHYEHLFQKGLLTKVPQGDVYEKVLRHYFIASPTMLVKKEVFQTLNGYDETLAYEDFDFWVRSARTYYYAFLNERLTHIRKKPGSMSTRLYTPGDRQLLSTYRVCQKAITLNRTSQEQQALVWRLRYELRQAVFSGNHQEAALFYRMLKKLKAKTWVEGVLRIVSLTRIDLSAVRRWGHWLRYGKAG